MGDLFESMVKRDLEVKDTGKLFGAHGGVLDRLDAVFFTVRWRTTPPWRSATPPRLSRVRRILIVGSTGSIGTQALDVVERNPELEVVGLAAALELGAAPGAGEAPRREPRRALGPGRRRARL